MTVRLRRDLAASSRRASRVPATLLRIAATLLVVQGVAGGTSRADDAASLAPGEGRARRYVVRSWDESPRFVRALGQSGDGFIWIGTESGLTRFDGHRLTSAAQAGVAEADRHVYAIARDEGGALWVAIEGVGLLRYEDGHFRSETSDDSVLAETVVSSIVVQGPDELWLGTEGRGLLHWQNGTVQPVAGCPSSVRCVVASGDGGLWIGTRGSGVLRLDDGQLQPLSNAGALGDGEILSLLEDHAGVLWIGARSGLYRHVGNTVQRFDTQVADSALLVLSIVEDASGALWMASSGQGLLRLEDRRFEYLTEADGLPEDDLRLLVLGDDGEIWVGTRTRGLARVASSSVRSITLSEGLSARPVLPILESPDGRVLVGTYGGGLDVISSEGIVNYGRENGLEDQFVLSLALDREGLLWIGTRTGVFTMRGETVSPSGPDSLLSGLLALALLETGDGVMWLGGSTGLYRASGGQVERVGEVNGVEIGFVLSLLEGRNGTIWVGTNGAGVVALDRAGGARQVTADDGLASDVVFALTEDPDGTLWVGTSLGLSRIRDGEVASLRRRDGLPDTAIYRIFTLDDGQIWLAGTDGIHRLHRSNVEHVMAGGHELSFLSLGVEDGMPSSETCGGVHPAGTKLRDGRLWIPTLEGVAIVDPQQMADQVGPKRISILSVTVDGERRRPTTDVAAMSIAPGPGRVTISYVVPEYRHADWLRFQHRLTGFRDGWQSEDAERQATFTGLGPGLYRFEVRARYRGGPWTVTSSPVEFVVEPYFYQTVWFRGLLVLVGLAVVVVGVQLRTRSIRRRARELERQVHERTRELAAAQREMVDLAYRSGMAELASGVLHNVGNLLNGVKVTSQLLRQRFRESRVGSLQMALGLMAEHREDLGRFFESDPKGRDLAEYLVAVGRALEQERSLGLAEVDELAEGVQQVELVVAAQQRYSGVEGANEQVQLAEIVDDSLRLVRHEIEGADVTVVREDSELAPIRVDRTRLVQVLVNLIKNAVEACSSVDGTIRVSVHAGEGGDQVIEVSDNGVGMGEEELGKVFGYRYSTKGGGRGLGLHVSALHVAAMGGRITAHSDGPQAGATLSIVLPASPAEEA